MNRIAIPVLACALALCACNEKPAEPAAPAPSAEPAKAPEPAAAAHDHAQAAAPSMELPPVPPGAKVAFVAPTDGAKLEGPLENGKVSVPIEMAAEGIAVKPAGPVEAGSGHHHVLIDVAAPIPAGAVVPKDEQHVHYGQGQTQAVLALAPGDHTLMLQFADGIHRSYGPQLSATIKISVAATGTVTATAK